MSQEETSQEQFKSAPSVTVPTLVTVALSVVAGAVVALLLRNALEGDSINFTTTGLLTILFGVALSAASIVLAIAAISLGRGSERAMTRRSDESIRIQNEVFAKTIEALARIESSTGVTEKRIEDIISGRAGAISDKIADTILADRGLQPNTRADIEREIRESLMAEISHPTPPKQPDEVREEKRKVEEQQKRYKDFKDAALLGVASLPNVQALKLGDGQFEGTGLQLVDALFKSDGGPFTISTFGADSDWTGNSRSATLLNTYIRSLAAEIAKGTFARCFLVFDRDEDDEPEFDSLLDNFRSIAKEDLASRFTTVTGRPEHVLETLAKSLEAPKQA